MRNNPLPNYRDRLVMVSWQTLSHDECQQRALAAVTPIMCKDATKPHTEWTYWDPHVRDHFADHVTRFRDFWALQVDLLRPTFDYLHLRDPDRLLETDRDGRRADNQPDFVTMHRNILLEIGTTLRNTSSTASADAPPSQFLLKDCARRVDLRPTVAAAAPQVLCDHVQLHRNLLGEALIA